MTTLRKHLELRPGLASRMAHATVRVPHELLDLDVPAVPLMWTFTRPGSDRKIEVMYLTRSVVEQRLTAASLMDVLGVHCCRKVPRDFGVVYEFNPPGMSGAGTTISVVGPCTGCNSKKEAPGDE